MTVSYDIKDKLTFKYVLEEAKKKLSLPEDARLIAYAGSYSTAEIITE